MNICELCIRRPVFASVLSIIILIVGIVSYTKLSTKQYPDVEMPSAAIISTYPGASPELVETSVTNVIEDNIAGIEGIDKITAKSTMGLSTITVEFTLETNINTAINELRSKVSEVISLLPKELDPPVVSKASQSPNAVIYLALFSDNLTIPEITSYAKRYVTKRLEVLDGVGKVQVFAGQDYQIEITPNPDLLHLHNISMRDIETAIRSQNKNYPVGQLSGGSVLLSLTMNLDMVDTKEFADIIVKKTNNNLVRLQDIATVKLGASGDKTEGKYNGKNSIIIAVGKQPEANPITISQMVQDELLAIKPDLPKDLNFKVAFDTAKFIKASIEAIYHTIFEAVILVVIVILVFIQSFRSSLIPIVTIPVSLIGSFFLMKAFGFSINNFTLLAMILAIGLVVDDAIVMMENIFRYIEDGLSPFEAAVKGSREILFAVLVMTITLIAVFVPVGFISGFVGKFFNEFAWTLAFCVAISGFVSLTLTPMMSAYILNMQHSEFKFFVKCNNIINIIHDRYHNTLIKALNHKKYILLSLPITLIIGCTVMFFIKEELLPIEDQGFVFIHIQSPQGATFNYTKKYFTELESIVATTKDVTNSIAFINPEGGMAFIDLKDWGKRSQSQMQIANNLNKTITNIPGIFAFALNLPSLPSNSNDSIQIVLEGHTSFEDLDKFAVQVIEKMRAIPIFYNVDKDIKLNNPAIKIMPNRDKVEFYNVDIATVGKTLNDNFVDIKIDNGFKKNGELYDVTVKLDDKDKANGASLDKVYVKNRDGKFISLLSLIDYEYGVEPTSLNHFNKQRAVTITASLVPGIPLGSVIKPLEQIASGVKKDSGVKYEFAGEIKDLQTTSYELYIIFGLAIIFIFLVLAAQFESYIDAGIILCSVPFAVVGALVTLYLIGGSMNIYSKIGLITLVGLIAKNGILIVEFTNQKIASGIEIERAVIEATTTRLRPILMTTTATIVGAVPLALASGPGSESRNEIGWTIVGGLAVGTFFTLFVVPAICVVIKKITAKT